MTHAPRNDLERFEMLSDAVDRAFPEWDCYNKEQRRYLATLIWNGIGGFRDDYWRIKAKQKVFTHQRLYTEILRVSGEYDDLTGGRHVDLF